MSFTDNFGNPQGLLGRIMLTMMEREHRSTATWAFSQLAVPAEGKMCDIGCGGGYNIKRLLEKSKTAFVYGLDISEESVRKAKKINTAELGKRCEILQGSAETLPFSDGGLDLVTAFETVYFWKNIERCFGEVRRALKGGGRFAVINNYGDPNIDWEKKVPCMTRYTAGQIRALMEQTGFTSVHICENGTFYLVEGCK